MNQDLDTSYKGMEQSPFLHDGSIMDEEEEEELVSLPSRSKHTTATTVVRRGWIPKLVCVMTIFIAMALMMSGGILIGRFAIRTGVSEGVSKNREEICSNPPLLIVSVDGFWSGYLTRNITPNLKNLTSSGVMASYMRSSFPTKTFPNHYSIVTGLYPESHGIVSNHFYDMKLKESFSIGGSNANDAKWWKGEPVWVTAVKNKLVAGTYFWPGSEAEIKGVRPTYYKKYNGDTPFNTIVDTVVGWLDLPKGERPQFMAMYFNQPDSAGHKGGPFSTLVNTALGEVDKAIGRLWEGLQKRGVAECVNIMITSDHGMTSYDSSDLVVVNQFFPNTSVKVDYPNLGPAMNLNVNGGDENVQEIYDAIVMEGTEMAKPFRAFQTRNMPLRLHTGHFNKERYGQIYLIGDDHSYISPDIPDYKVSTGLHGYDNLDKQMQAIFIAHGPAFKKNYVSDGFENVQLYSLMCNLLNITAAPHNGSVGALYHFLTPEMVSSLPPPQSFGGLVGITDTCTFPKDRAALVEASLCDECVCRDVCNVEDDIILANNAESFNLTSLEVSRSQSEHLPWGVPLGGRGNGACVLTQPGYISLYSNDLRIPLWSSYTIHKEGGNKNGTWTDVCIRRDPRITSANSANCSLFNESSSSDDDVIGLKFTPTNLEFISRYLSDSEEETFYSVSALFPFGTSRSDALSMSVLTNVVPMLSAFYYDVWGELNQVLSSWLMRYGTLNVISGSILDADRNGERDSDSTYPYKEGGVAIPSHYYMVVTRCNQGKLCACDVGDMEVISFLFQHPLERGDYMDTQRILTTALTPLRDIERVSGVNFFPERSSEEQNILELRLVDTLWPNSSPSS